MVAAAEIGELESSRGRHEQLARVRIRECAPDAAKRIRLIENRSVDIVMIDLIRAGGMTMIAERMAVDTGLDAFSFGTPQHLFQYLVAWRGYPPEENTWESRAAVADAEALAEFEHDQREAASED